VKTDNRQPLVNFSIKMKPAEADQLDELVSTLRKTTGNRLLTRADIVREFLRMASSETTLQTKLTRNLTRATARR
jgi:hypothetical protein